MQAVSILFHSIQSDADVNRFLAKPFLFFGLSSMCKEKVGHKKWNFVFENMQNIWHYSKLNIKSVIYRIKLYFCKRWPAFFKQRNDEWLLFDVKLKLMLIYRLHRSHHTTSVQFSGKKVGQHIWNTNCILFLSSSPHISFCDFCWT